MSLSLVEGSSSLERTLSSSSPLARTRSQSHPTTMPSTMYQQYPHNDDDNDDLVDDYQEDDPDAHFAYLKDVLAGTIDPPVDTHWMEKSHAMHSVDVLLEQIDSAIRDLNTAMDDGEEQQEDDDDELERRLTATSTRSAPRPFPHQRSRHVSGEAAVEGAERTGSVTIWDHKRAHSAPAPAPAPRLVAAEPNTVDSIASTTSPLSSLSSLSSSADPLILHAGYLRKLTHSRPLGSKTYRPRFLVLTSSHLYLFRSSNPQEASITALPITPTTAAYVSESGLWVLHVQSQGMDESGAFVTRNWSLQCADKEEMVGWLAALRTAIERRRMSLKGRSDKLPGLNVLSQHGRGILLQELSHHTSSSTRPVAAFGQPATLFGSGYGQTGYGGPPTTPGSNPDLSPALAILEGLERLHSPTSPTTTNSTEPRDYFTIPITTQPSTSSSRDDASINSSDTPTETKKERKAREKMEKKEKLKLKKKDQGLSFGAAMSMVI
ncbi:uncharacterized protein SPPG_01290 [Spizellomyces punctatus DAOM BR117]|uniref:PH domain-containing protein n=1 Tax=Spizellomyces punctatus (strain DAOM BR117) TaxID=645134 RepID=A0A0L0HRS9_SPIPD|nr:uncharacterized protein SPPG_01290 [Spizellomyces punctatus DAOM BR117]KND03833.1 hypothetical protein SPPG_01290 [Spizellomyces punctatus DAOM BR117]|eukprot:XP_016611872.1 hypothetical protein SPPG_01290 [Spizellomyces punctatus DAOM BR117]